jgi:hypothetical protein
VVAAREHPNADKLLLLQIKIGDEERQIVAGIRGHYEPEALVGTQLIVVVNLAEAVAKNPEACSWRSPTATTSCWYGPSASVPPAQRSSDCRYRLLNRESLLGYQNHMTAVRIQLDREPYPLPKIETKNFKSIYDWTYSDTHLINYHSHDRISAEIAI